MKQHKLELEEVVAKLLAWRDQTLVELRCSETHDKAIQRKRQLDAAIHCLEFCQLHQINPAAKVLVLPDTQTQSPSSNYRIVEDHETDNIEHWVELKIEGETLHLYPGDILIS